MTTITSAPVALGYATGSNFTQVWSINDEDEVAGGTASSGAVWQDGKITLIPVASGAVSGLATAVTSEGEVAGFSSTGTVYDSVLWQNGAELPLSGLGNNNRLYDISDQGIIVGSAEDGSGLIVAIEIKNGAVTQLGELPGGHISVTDLAASRAFSINDQGQIVGLSLTADDVQHAVLWQNGTVTDLGSLPGGGQSVAYQINDHGVVVGFAVDANGIDQATVWQNGTMTELPDHQSNGHSIAFGINDAGVIVGRSDLYTISTGWQQDAVMWQNGLLIDLNTLLPDNSGWVLNVAHSINDNGEIAGTGTYDGVATAFVLSIGDSSGPMMTAAAALQSFQATPHGAALSVSDTASAISADLDGLQAMASLAKLLQIQVSDGAASALTVTATQLASDAAALADISGTYSLHVTGESIGAAGGALATAHVTAVGISDSAFGVWNSLDQLRTWADAGELTGISLTDSGLPTLEMTVQEMSEDALVLKLIQGSYQLRIPDATVAQALTIAAAYDVGWVDVTDTIDAAVTAASQLKAMKGLEGLSLSGSAADFSANFDSLESLSQVTGVSVTVTDKDVSTLSITGDQFAYSRVFSGLHGNVILSVDASQDAGSTIAGIGTSVPIIADFANPAGDYAVSSWAGVSGGISIRDEETGGTTDVVDVTALQFKDGTDFLVEAPSAAGITSGNVAELYSAVLARTPDVAGLGFYEQAIEGASPPSLLQLAGYFLQSPEYTGNTAHNYAQSAGGDAQFIADTYANLLHRAPDGGAVAYYQNVISHFTAGLTPGSAAYSAAQLQGHAQVLVYFSASSEFLGDVQITAQHPADAQHWLYVV